MKKLVSYKIQAQPIIDAHQADERPDSYMLGKLYDFEGF